MDLFSMRVGDRVEFGNLTEICRALDYGYVFSLDIGASTAILIKDLSFNNPYRYVNSIEDINDPAHEVDCRQVWTVQTVGRVVNLQDLEAII